MMNLEGSCHGLQNLPGVREENNETSSVAALWTSCQP